MLLCLLPFLCPSASIHQELSHLLLPPPLLLLVLVLPLLPLLLLLPLLVQPCWR
jgi:hypothetical protein